MARNTNPWVLHSQYLAVRALAMGLTSVNADASMAAARGVGRIVCMLDRRHRMRAFYNLRRSLAGAPPRIVDELVVGSFEHLLQLAMEVCHTPRIIHPHVWTQRVELTDMGPAIAQLSSGKPALLVTGHMGNWEILGYLLATLGFKVHAIARPLDNPLINDWLLGIREKRGLSIITKWDARETMLDVVQRGELLAFIADQDAGAKGLFVPFFGKLASTYKSIGLLALHQNLPIICGYAMRRSQTRGCQYQLGTTDVIHPHEWADQPDPLFYVTARYTRAIEKMVRLALPQYFWMHRRWKTRPRWEREGKVMPVSVRKNLESLPWMTPAELDSLGIPIPAQDLSV